MLLRECCPEELVARFARSPPKSAGSWGGCWKARKAERFLIRWRFEPFASSLSIKRPLSKFSALRLPTNRMSLGRNPLIFSSFSSLISLSLRVLYISLFIYSKMGKPRMIILIRHAQSEGNSMYPKNPLIDAVTSMLSWLGLVLSSSAETNNLLENRDIHQEIPDHRVKLTPEGWIQAYDAGRRLRSLLRADDTLHFFTSPYRRTRETTEGILSTLTSDDPSPSPFPRHSIKVYEEPRLREQDFGNFQPCSAEMERMWQERADYGHFFYRIPNGESAADAYDRISGFNESLWRQFGEDDCASVYVLGK